MTAVGSVAEKLPGQSGSGQTAVVLAPLPRAGGSAHLFWESWTIIAWLARAPSDHRVSRHGVRLLVCGASLRGLIIAVSIPVAVYVVRAASGPYRPDIRPDVLLAGATLFWADAGTNFFSLHFSTVRTL